MVTTRPSLHKPVAAQTHSPGWIARLGGWSTGHFRVLLVGWLVVVGVLGAFAPRVESALSGAG